MSFESESVNENVFFVKGKVHCFVATLDGKELRQNASKICIRYRFFSFPSKDKSKTKKSKKGVKNYGNKCKKNNFSKL